MFVGWLDARARLCDDSIGGDSSSIDHELQFVYARFDIAE